MQGKVEICGVNTATLPVLKCSETRALLQKARAGDKGAREELISGITLRTIDLITFNLKVLYVIDMTSKHSYRPCPLCGHGLYYY